MNEDLEISPLDLRKKLLEKVVKDLINLSTFYYKKSPARLFIQNSLGHIYSIYYIETTSDIDSETIGAKE